MASKARNRSSRAGADEGGQRQRLIEAMTQVAARHGYRGASVARVVEGAGVSRATFYEQFAGKEACFLAAFELTAERIERGLTRIEAEFSPASRADELLDELLDSMVGDPAAASVLLVEALAGGPAVRQAHERFILGLEATLERWLAESDGNGHRLTVPGRAVVEGIGGTLLIRCFRGEAAQLGELRDDLLAWLYSYVAPTGLARLSPEQWRQLGAGLVPAPATAAPKPAAKLPRGRSAIAPEQVAGAQRERILAAVGTLARTEGFLATTVADIVREAAVTREAFYAQFRNKEDAFLAAQSAGLEKSIPLTGAGFFAGETWPERVWGGLAALLGYVATEPDVVYLDVIESYAAGSAALRRSFDNRMAYGLFFEDGYRHRPPQAPLPRLSSEAIGNAIVGTMRWHVSEGRTERMLELLPQAAYVALAPFIGAAAALEFVSAKAAGQSLAPTG
ncbi:MAG TPA: helix-turn-helix domain-containing protein [Solirubrobacterales bacterium]|nr:helix-turn-helix domain-containing protein [Solirubrobacterales bacterium]